MDCRGVVYYRQYGISGRTSGLSRATSTTWIRQRCSASSRMGPLTTLAPTQRTKLISNFPSGTRLVAAVMPTLQFITHGKPQAEWRFQLGRQLPSQRWKPYYGKDGMEIRSRRVHGNEWRSSNRICCRCHQDRNLFFEHDQHSANGRPSRYQSLVLRRKTSRNQSAIIRDFRFVPH